MGVFIVGGSLADNASALLSDELIAHLPVAEQAAADNLNRVRGIDGAKLDEFQRQLDEAQTPKVPAAQKLIRIRHLASEFSGLFAAHTACASGCSHCCNIGTAVPRSEAKVIAKAIKRPLSEPRVKYDIETSSQRQDYFGVPCTFLKGGRCSIYAHRPLVCRTLVNMDDVNTLCKLVPDMQVPVPYLNTTNVQGYFAFLTFSEQFADIREWFPMLGTEIC